MFKISFSGFKVGIITIYFQFIKEKYEKFTKAKCGVSGIRVW